MNYNTTIADDPARRAFPPCAGYSRHDRPPPGNSLNSVEYSVTYWREGDYEVDFVIARGRDVWAIEVKSGRSGRTAGLTRFRNRYPAAKALLVGAQGIPLTDFFSRPAAAWLV